MSTPDRAESSRRQQPGVRAQPHIIIYRLGEGSAGPEPLGRLHGQRVAPVLLAGKVELIGAGQRAVALLTPVAGPGSVAATRLSPYKTRIGKVQCLEWK